MLTGLSQSSGGCEPPCGLSVSLSTLRRNCFAIPEQIETDPLRSSSLVTRYLPRHFDDLANSNARLGSRCWLGFTASGLSPDKKRHASLGAQQFSGTSFAAPAVTGTLALLNELNHDNGGSPFLASTWKALLLNTATDGTKLDHIKVTAWDVEGNPTTTQRVSGLMGPTVSAVELPGPDYFYGWGMVNARAAADLLYANLRSASGRAHICELLLTDPSNNANDNDNLVIEVPIERSGENEEMKIMICWSDPAYHLPGTSSFSSHVLDPEVGSYDLDTKRLVNDLDLFVLIRKINRLHFIPLRRNNSASMS